MLFDVLEAHAVGNIGEASANMPIIIQSFEKNSLVKMSTLTDLPLVQLCWKATTNYDFNEIATYANGVGVPSDWIMDPPTSIKELLSAEDQNETEK